MRKFILAFALMAVSAIAFSQDVDKMIKQDDVEHIIKTLSADDMQGRATFTPGIEKAARFIESEYKQIGLQPFDGDAGYRQNFTMTRITPVAVAAEINGKAIAADSIIASTSAP